MWTECIFHQKMHVYLLDGIPSSMTSASWPLQFMQSVWPVWWLDYLSTFGHLHERKLAQLHTKLAKLLPKICQIEIKSPHNCPRLLRFCQSDEISSNLVTLNLCISFEGFRRILYDDQDEVIFRRDEDLVLPALDPKVGQLVGRIQIPDDRFGTIGQLRDQNGVLQKNRIQCDL